MPYSDMKASAPLAATGAFGTADNASVVVGRARIKAAYIANGTTAGSVVIADGVGGNTMLTLATPANSVEGTTQVIFPEGGILCKNGPYGTVTNTASIVLIYDGL
jgi:hypothetical protein